MIHFFLFVNGAFSQFRIFKSSYVFLIQDIAFLSLVSSYSFSLFLNFLPFINTFMQFSLRILVGKGRQAISSIAQLRMIVSQF